MRALVPTTNLYVCAHIRLEAREEEEGEGGGGRSYLYLHELSASWSRG